MMSPWTTLRTVRGVIAMSEGVRARIERVRVYHDGKWKLRDDLGWTRLADERPRSAELKRLYVWAHACVSGGGYDGVDRRRNRPDAYFAEIDAETDALASTDQEADRDD